MKTLNNLFKTGVWVFFLLFLAACAKDELTLEEIIAMDICEDPCANPEECPGKCIDENSESSNKFTKEDIQTEGTVTETDDGFKLEGELHMETDSSGTVVFKNADVDVQFNADGTLNGVSGTVEVPSPSNYFEFTDPIQADIGFFTGKYLNENRDFEILLVDEISYFVYNIAVTVELKIGANDDPDATKPLSIKPPVGGHITFIADYNDPMFFFSVGHDLLGSGSVGASFQGKIPYVPTNPLEDVVSFGAKSVRGGSFSFWKIMEVSGVFYENKEISADVNFEEPMEAEFGLGYKAGINGELTISAPIKSFGSFGFPIGAGSAAFVAESSTNNGVTAKAFFNGLVEPDTSWWPDFIPLKANGKLNAYGYVAQTGSFDFGLSGSFGIKTPKSSVEAEGILRATNEAFTMEGRVNVNDEIWGAKATFSKDETLYVASPPEGFLNGVSAIVTQQVDSTFAVHEKALEDLKKAAENYELELSLRGLKEVIPGFINNANRIIDESVAAGIASGRRQANEILSDNGRALCSDNISNVVNGIVKPYKDALARLKKAIEGSDNNDTEQTRIELEKALRDLIKLDKIDVTANIRITHGNKKILFVPACTQRSNVTRQVTIRETVLSAEYIAQLTRAADNVKYIGEASTIKIEAQLIVDRLPSIEDLENLRNSINDCVSKITDNIGDVGFRKNHTTNEYTYFVMINGEETSVEGFDIFDSNSVIAIARPEFDGCDVTEALKSLQK